MLRFWSPRIREFPFGEDACFVEKSLIFAVIELPLKTMLSLLVEATAHPSLCSYYVVNQKPTSYQKRSQRRRSRMYRSLFCPFCSAMRLPDVHTVDNVNPTQCDACVPYKIQNI